MSDQQYKVRIERIGLKQKPRVPRPPWRSKPIDAPISVVDGIIRAYLESGHRVADRIELTGKDIIAYDFVVRTQLEEPFTLFVMGKDNTTLLYVDTLPKNPKFYITRFATLMEHFARKNIEVTIHAPWLEEDDSLIRTTLAELKSPERLSAPPAPRPKTKDLLAEYKKAKRRNKYLTLKEYCESVGANYGSVRVAKSRSSKRRSANKK